MSCLASTKEVHGMDRVTLCKVFLRDHADEALDFSTKADLDSGLDETGALLPRPDATLAGATFEQRLDSTG